MENKEGILLSGGGRTETAAELSKSEQLFQDIAEFLFENDPDVKKNYKSIDNFKRILLEEVRKTVGRKREQNLSAGLEESDLKTVLIGMLYDYKALTIQEKINKRKKQESDDDELGRLFRRLGSRLPMNVVDDMFSKERIKKDKLTN